MTEQELTDTLTSIVGGLAGVKIKAYGARANFTVGEKEKIFSFTRKDGVVFKLPAERVTELEKTRGATALIMGKKTMKEWVVVPYGSATALKKDAKLLKEAMVFAAGKS